ncbi:MAG: hypothetical protein Q6K99_06400 [Thermostichales cyanobacterium BF4_bins_65]
MLRKLLAIIGCPHCGFLYKQPPAPARNATGAILWSDGYEYAPLAPDPPLITRCWCCNQFFWMVDALVANKAVLGDMEAEVRRHSPTVQDLTLQGYSQALDAGVGTDPLKQRHLLIYFWWKVNDLVRDFPDRPLPAGKALLAYHAYQPKVRRCLAELVPILEDDDPNDYLMKAEIAREMGDFSEAIRLLHDLPAKMHWVADQIREWAQAGDTTVRRLRRDL